MNKRLSSAATVALKEALCNVYWYKSDLRSFLQSCVSEKTLVASLNWGNYKRQVVSDLVDQLCSDQESHLGDLTRLCYEVVNINSFKHLEQLEGGAEKVKRAREAVSQLKALLEPHDELRKESDAIAERQRRFKEKLKANSAVRAKLQDINQRFLKTVSSPEAAERGYELERIMYDLFELFDLDPKASFRNTGEQIDGAFSFEGTEYLFEARWRKEPVAVDALDAFSGKVNRKLENTLGVFLSMNGFSKDGITAHSKGRPSIILMDGADMMAVLEERTEFVSLLLRKKRHAAQTGNIFLPFHQFGA